MQTALRRAQAQDEAIMRSGGKIPSTPVSGLSTKSPPPAPVMERSPDCDSSASSQCSATGTTPVAVIRKNSTHHVEPLPSTTNGNFVGTIGKSSLILSMVNLRSLSTITSVRLP